MMVVYAFSISLNASLTLYVAIIIIAIISSFATYTVAFMYFSIYVTVLRIRLLRAFRQSFNQLYHYEAVELC